MSRWLLAMCVLLQIFENDWFLIFLIFFKFFFKKHECRFKQGMIADRGLAHDVDVWDVSIENLLFWSRSLYLVILLTGACGNSCN